MTLETYFVDDDITDQPFWSALAAPGSAAVASDPADGANQVLSIVARGTGGTWYERSDRRVAEGDTGTLFLRFRYDGPPTEQFFGIGMTDLSYDLAEVLAGNVGEPSPLDMMPQFSIINWGNGRNIFTVRIASTIIPPETIRQVDFHDLIVHDTWYSLWSVIDNNSDSHQVYIQGGSIPAQMQLFRSDNGSPDFPFRNSTPNDIVTFLTYASSRHGGPMMIDDIYLDSSNDSHLTNPILPVSLEGDYNFDNVVDAADYTVWRDSGGTPDGYDTWKANFGNSAGAGALVTNAAVPEPSSTLIICLLVAVIAAGARRRDARGIR